MGRKESCSLDPAEEPQIRRLIQLAWFFDVVLIWLMSQSLTLKDGGAVRHLAGMPWIVFGADLLEGASHLPSRWEMCPVQKGLKCAFLLDISGYPLVI